MKRTFLAVALSPTLLIDTHIWLWLMEGAAELKAAARQVINHAAEQRRLRLSIMSVWEIAMLSSRGRIRLSQPVATWVDNSLAGPGPIVEPITREIAIASSHLPDNFRSDPTDQIIVATARVTGATLLTRDRRILDYAATGYVNAIAA